MGVVRPKLAVNEEVKWLERVALIMDTYYMK
jgi:hypothetical protein